MFKVSEISNVVKNFIFLQTLLHFKVNFIQINRFFLGGKQTVYNAMNPSQINSSDHLEQRSD